MKIICVGRNYVAHAEELNNEVPGEPIIFMKPPSALLVNQKPFYYPEFSRDIHYELELVIKICKNGRHVQPQFASRYYNEITLGIDFTARDVQSVLKSKGHPWEIAKGFDGSAVLGTFIPMQGMEKKDIAFRLERNGEIVQKGNSGLMIFDFDYLITYVSRFFKLQMGDLIYTGTPAGVGPISIGDKLEGYLGDRSLLKCAVR